MVKKHARKEYAQKRLGLGPGEREAMERSIAERFASLGLSGYRTLMSYSPIPGRNEFNVGICEQIMQIRNERLRITWPRLRSDMISMDAVVVREGSTLVRNAFNIPEPSGDEIIPPGEIDFIFVPLLAFDTKGYRVGYGKGFYDRYLAGCRKDAVKAGFSYFHPLDAIDDIDEFDVPLNLCITPWRIYEF